MYGGVRVYAQGVLVMMSTLKVLMDPYICCIPIGIRELM